jgi:lipase ATG15
MIDDVAQNFQHIRCEAGLTDVIGCHNSIRSLCEINYSCGSRNRPVLCVCVTEFGYPEPTPKDGTNRTFQEACGIVEEEG